MHAHIINAVFLFARRNRRVFLLAPGNRRVFCVPEVTGVYYVGLTNLVNNDWLITLNVENTDCISVDGCVDVDIVGFVDGVIVVVVNDDGVCDGHVVDSVDVPDVVEDGDAGVVTEVRAALVESCGLGAFPPVCLVAVCFVRANNYTWYVV